VNGGPGARTRRLFFALWPDARVRAQLVALSRHLARRPVADDKLHMTLLFLGRRSEQERACFCQAASKVRCQPFEIQMNYLGGWPRAGIQWLGTSQVPGVLSGLVGSLTAVLEPCGFEAEKRPFVPHITLARKVRHPKVKTGMEAIRWPVRDFVLVESAVVEGGARYEVLQRWPFEENA
jgi:2'-5' RNA ligase